MVQSTIPLWTRGIQNVSLCRVFSGRYFAYGIYTPVCVYLMRGEYDDRLVWPFRGDITVQVVNQSSDQNHKEYTFKFNDKCAISSCSRVTSGEKAGSGSIQYVFTLVDSENMYIKGDTVKFRVTKVSVAS